MTVENPFIQPIQPWISLFEYARKVQLPKNMVNVFCYDTGNLQAPSTILVHGLGDEADTWRYIKLGLSRSHRVLALDSPGFGRIDKPRGTYSVPYYEDILLELMDVLEVSQAGKIQEADSCPVG